MKKRLRKKLNLGEFSELGFEFFAELDETLDENAQDQLFDEFVAIVDDNEMYCEGGWAADGVDLYVSTGLINTDNENRRDKFMADVEKLAGLKNVKATELEVI